VNVPFFGQKYLQYFSNMSGYFLEAYGRRFYYGFTIFTSVVDGAAGSCQTSSIFIPSPKYSPLILTVTDNALMPGTIAGFTIITQPSSSTPSSAFIVGSPDSVLDRPSFCLQGPEYLQLCLGINPYPATEQVQTTTQMMTHTTAQMQSTTVVVEMTTAMEVNQTNKTSTNQTSTKKNGAHHEFISISHSTNRHFIVDLFAV